ncbi:fungal-specific transcription factor domain-containing protein [Xylaria cf. heliscus]|nr:fungal-specific transcription factor domain-containing protein [Xylaria cf. heliscus]
MLSRPNASRRLSMTTIMATLPIATRSYRSHTQPACIPCRKRKSRCKLDSADSTTCSLCKLHGSECVFPDPSAATISAASSYRRARKRVARQRPDVLPQPRFRLQPCTFTSHEHEHEHDLPPPRVVSAHNTSGTPAVESSCSPEVPFAEPLTPESPSRDESHVIGPVQSSDTHLIANYLFNNPGIGPHAGRMIVTRPDHLISGKRPVLFNAVRRSPLGHVPAPSLLVSICEVVTKLLEPHCDILVDVYFSKVHQCFPILDERTFRLQYTTQKKKISPVLLTSLYAQSIVYWRHSSSAFNKHYPDLRFIWNKANEALNLELYTSPGLSAIAAILLNISGRPLTAMIGNGVLLGSAISLAHSLGLNRNCLDWNIAPSEKLLRTRLWWAIVIFDKWFSVTYGTPQQLRASQHDVPPSALTFVADDSQMTHVSATCFTFEAFVGLSQVLETYLDHIYNLHQPSSDGRGTIRIRLEKQLAEWEDNLTNELRRVILRGTNLSIPGCANLRLSYLYLRLLIQKLGIDDVKQNQPIDPEELDSRLIYARQAAESIVLFIQELDDAALRDFWFPFNAFALSGTVAFLFRCALESEKGGVSVAQSRYLKLAKDLIIALRSHQFRMNWDLGNICVAQYATILDHVASDDRSLETISDLHQLCPTDFAEFDQMSLNDWDLFQIDGSYFQ